MGYSSMLNEILTLEVLKNGLQYLKTCLLEGITSEEEILKRTGMTRGELFRLKELLNVKDFSSTSLIYNIDVKISTLNDEIKELKFNLFQPYTLYIFYNWRKGLKVRWPGIYRGRNVRTISKSMVILLAHKEIQWTDVAGRECKGLIGSGIYFSEFIPEDVNETITFYRNIHGVLLTSKLLEELRDSPPRIVGRYESMHKELISIIPISAIIRDTSMRNYLKNILITTLLRSKDIYVKFLEALRDNANREVKTEDISFLSALPEFYNKIIMTSKSYESLIEEVQNNISAPGLSGYEGKLETLNDFLKNISLDEIPKEIKKGATLIVNNGWELLTSLL